MAADNTSDVLPILSEGLPSFDPAMRGYDRDQVDSFVAQLDADLRVANAERDAIAARSADFAAQLASAQAQNESLRRQLKAATTEITAENVNEHVAQILKTAHTDAAKVRAAAERHAEDTRNRAADAAAGTTAAAQSEAARILAAATAHQTEADEMFRRRLSEIEARSAAVEKELAESTERTRIEVARLTRESEAERDRWDAEAAAERERLNSESAAERERLEAKSSAQRTQAEEDFDITLRIRRTTEYAKLDRDRADANAAAAKTVADAQARAEQLVDDALAEVRRLRTIRDEAHHYLRALHGRLGDSLDDSITAGDALDAQVSGPA